jgi:hypothetical protein
VDRGVQAITEVIQKDVQFWQSLCSYARQRAFLSSEDEKALYPALNKLVPTDRQATRLMGLLERCQELGFEM